MMRRFFEHFVAPLIEKTKKSVSLKRVAWSVAMLAIGAGIAWYATNSANVASMGGFETRMGQQGFTNPLLDCSIGADTISAKKEDFSADLLNFVNVLKQKPSISQVSVYFRDLNNGPIVGVNQNEPFAPASLLKVPIMMAYYNRAEDEPGLLDKKIKFEEASTLLPDTQNFVPQEQIQLGHTYTIEQLIEYMIKYSDNQAMVILYNQLPVADQVELYTEIGVDPAAITDSTASLTVKQYSVFFRILFNASYLSREDSEKALELLSESTFNDGLRAGVPTTIPIAHKFGERQFSDQLQQLHDCGIVYYPMHPYLLCVMTRGSSISDLTQAIADTSRFVYDKIDGEYGAKQ